MVNRLRTNSVRLLLTFLLIGVAGYAVDPFDQLLKSLKPHGLVNYFADVISSADEEALIEMLSEVRQKTGAELTVVTIRSMEGGEIDDFTNRLFEQWGVGQKDKNNGLMFLASMSDRKMRIEVGYGLEAAIPDSKAGRIRRDIFTPYFKKMIQEQAS